MGARLKATSANTKGGRALRARPAGVPLRIKRARGREIREPHRGNLPSDVIQTFAAALLIADFGVDWRTPKNQRFAKRMPQLRNWLGHTVIQGRGRAQSEHADFGSAATADLRSAGRNNNNFPAAGGRAANVCCKLLQAALPGPQWANSAPEDRLRRPPRRRGGYVRRQTVRSKAAPQKTRGVLIEHARTIDFAPDEGSVVTGRIPDTNRTDMPKGVSS